MNMNQNVRTVQLAKLTKHHFMSDVTEALEVPRVPLNVTRRMDFHHKLPDSAHMRSKQSGEQAKFVAFDIDLHEHIAVAVERRAKISDDIRLYSPQVLAVELDATIGDRQFINCAVERLTPQTRIQVQETLLEGNVLADAATNESIVVAG
jgi:hypothetical protein